MGLRLRLIQAIQLSRNINTHRSLTKRSVCVDSGFNRSALFLRPTIDHFRRAYSSQSELPSTSTLRRANPDSILTEYPEHSTESDHFEDLLSLGLTLDMASSQASASAKIRKQAGQAKFYAVRAGHTPGIYTTWKECETNITGFKGAVYKSFPSQLEAADFVAGREPNVEPSDTTKYYGVASGLVPGVYTSWAAAQAQIVGQKGPKYKKFATREEAVAFVSSGGKSLPPTSQAKPKTPVKPVKPANGKRKKDAEEPKVDDKAVESRPKKKSRRVEDIFAVPSDDEVAEDTDDSDDALEVQLKKASADEYTEPYDVAFENEAAVDDSQMRIYTDGSSRGNGKLGAVAGVGVFFGVNDKRNVSEPLAGLPQTNQRAELCAILRALELAPLHTEVSIYTDSQYSIQCVTEWHRKWERCDWKTATGQPVLNRDLIQGILTKIRERLALKAKTNFVKVKGHSNDPGNEAADSLATAGSLKAQIARQQ